MGALKLKLAAALIVAGLGTGMAASVHAETQTENIVAEMRTYVYLQVAANTAQSFLPAGWAVNPPAAGAMKDANFIVLFLDRKLGLTPDGKQLQAGINRLLVVLVPCKNTQTGEAANMIVGGYSTDPAGSPGAYGVYGAGAVNVERVEHGAGKLEATVEENWTAKGENGELDLRIGFTRGVPALGAFEAHNYSSANPAFYRIYRGEQTVDVVRSVNTGVDRVQSVALKASGGKLASAINGSEKIVAITSLPFYRRNTFLP